MLLSNLNQGGGEGFSRKEKPEIPFKIMTVCGTDGGDKARLMYHEGNLDLGVVSTGQCVGLAHDIPTVKALFDRIMKEAESIVNGIKVV